MKLKNYCAVAAIAALSASSASAALVVHYTLDDDGGGGVSSANTGTAAHTWNGTANATSTTGKFGGAGSFQSAAPTSDWWSNSATGANLELFTLSLHVSGTAIENWRTFVSIGDGNGSSFRFEQNGSHGGTSVYTSGTPGGGSGSIDGSGAGAVTDGGWHHVAMVSNGTTLESFVDGVSQGSFAYTGTGSIDAFQLAANFGVGSRQTVSIDDVAIYDEALTQGQITWLGSNVATSAVPEPSSAVLLGLGGLALILRRRK